VIAIRPLAGADGRDDLQIRLQNFADEVAEVALSLPARPTGAARTTFLGDDLEQLPVEEAENGHLVRVTVPRLGSTAVRLKR